MILYYDWFDECPAFGLGIRFFMKQMLMKNYFFIVLTLLLSTIAMAQPKLISNGTATQLLVDNKPFIVLGGELGNSSASNVADVQRIFPKLNQMGLNTVLVPAYWELIEPIEGQFDFSLTDTILQTAQKNNLKVIFLWFGAWKNSMSCYAPQWVKTDYERFPRAHTSQGKPLEIASAFSPNVLKADSTAFITWFKHILSVDKQQTVVMIQIENEIGMLEDARDHSAVANKLFNEQVPQTLISYLTQNKKTLHPIMLEKWGNNKYKTSGSWAEIFGSDIYTDELFMAYYYATYVEHLASAARHLSPIPLYVNAAMNSRGRIPGQYPSAGPLAHLIDIWHCAAPSLDIISPDIYDSGFTTWASQYKLHNNSLFIPEMRLCADNGVQAFYAIAEHDAIGVSPFSIENGSESNDAPMVRAYRTLRSLMPIITANQGKGTMHGFLFSKADDERIILDSDLKITCKHFFTLPWDARATDGSAWPNGGGMLIQLNNDEYLLAGSGIVTTFEHQTENNTKKHLGEDGFEISGTETTNTQWNGTERVGILSCNEVMIDNNGLIQYIRRLNGDEDHQGRHVRIGVDDFKILHVKLYRYK